MKKFFSLEHFYEWKIFFILELVMALLLFGIFNTPPNDKFLEPYHLFNIWALLVSIAIWIICSLVDPKKYFNFFTLLSTVSFEYGCFWFMFEFMTSLPIH